MVDASIKWTYYDNVHPSQVLENLKRFIGYRQRLRAENLEYWYVGQTDDPETRLRQHQNACDARGDPRWTHMFVIYGHWDIGFVTEMENGLIQYLGKRSGRPAGSFRRTDPSDPFFNEAGPKLGGTQLYSVYVLVDDHPTSSSGGKRKCRDAEVNASHRYPEPARPTDAGTREAKVVEAFDRAVSVGGAGKGRPFRYVYVGVTNEPRRRFAEHQNKMTADYGGNLWEEMRVVYETNSLQRALQIETFLIDHAGARKDLKLHNSAPGRFAWYNANDLRPHFFVYYLEDRGNLA